MCNIGVIREATALTRLEDKSLLLVSPPNFGSWKEGKKKHLSLEFSSVKRFCKPNIKMYFISALYLCNK